MAGGPRLRRAPTRAVAAACGEASVTHPRSPLLPIFLIVLVDVLGFAIVIPLLALFAEKFGASPLIATTLVSVYAVCSLVSTPVIGLLSDRYGRRRLLLFSQAGTLAGFVVLGTATSLWMLFLGRIIDGVTAGNLSTAQAYISDHTKPAERAKAFGIIGIAFGIGFMVGPGLGGWLGDAFGMHVPFIVAAALSAVSMVCTATLLPRDLPAQPPAKQPAARGGGPRAFDVRTYVDYFRRPGLRSLYVQFFLFTLAFSAFTSGFALFAEARFGWGAHETGYLFMYSGVVGAFLQGRLIGPLVEKVGEMKLALAGFLIALGGYVLLGFAQTVVVLVAGATFNALGNGVLRPVLTSQITRQVGAHERGAAIGISGSLNSLAMILAPPIGGAMLDRQWTLAWAMVPASIALLGFVGALIARREIPSP